MPDAPEVRPAKDTRFDPSRIPVSDAAKAIVADVRGQLLNYEKYFGLRQRARRRADQARFDRMVSAIVCDLMHAALVNPQGWRHVSLSKRHSADDVGASFMTEDRIKIIQWMATPEMDWLEFEKGVRLAGFGGRQSRIRASARLQERIDEHSIEFEDIGRDPSLMGDPILLRSEKLRGKAKPLEVPRGQPVETYRDEVLRINAWLSQAKITCDFDDAGYPRDIGERWLKRIFNNGRFDHGGRLYGGFWQGLSAETRLSDIRLNDEPVVSLDFGQCGVRIAYSLADAQPPDGDLYSVPGLSRYRDGVKMVLNAMLAAPEKLNRKPSGSRMHLPQHWRIGEIEEAILRHHPCLHHVCYRGLGTRLQFIESQVLIRALQELMEMNIPALPIHDGLLAPSSVAMTVEKIMLGSFKEITGMEGVISTHRKPSVPSTSIPSGDTDGGNNYSSPSSPHKRGA